MKKLTTLLAATAVASLMATAAWSKTFVYCSEASPEGFDPGLYDPNDERDACGFGMIAQLDDQPSRALVDTAIAALSRMTHRGGVAADGLTGDGCGLLIRKPEAFLRALAAESGIDPGAEVDAMSELIADLSRDVARAALALPPVEVTAGGAAR